MRPVGGQGKTDTILTEDSLRIPKKQFLSFKKRPECIDAMRKTQLQGDFYESIFGNLNPCGNMSLPKIENESEQGMFYLFTRNYILEQAVLVSKF